MASTASTTGCERRTDESAVKLCTLLDEFIYELRIARPERVGDALADVGDAGPTSRWRPSTACGSRPSPPRRSRRTRAWRPTESSSSSSSARRSPAIRRRRVSSSPRCRAAQVFLPGRERTKTNNIRMLHEARMTLRELGRRMVERGAFDEIEDFGMLPQGRVRRLPRRPARIHSHDPGAPGPVRRALRTRAAVRVRRRAGLPRRVDTARRREQRRSSVAGRRARGPLRAAPVSQRDERG